MEIVLVGSSGGWLGFEVSPEATLDVDASALLDDRGKSPFASLLFALTDGISSPLDSAARGPSAVGELCGTGKPQLPNGEWLAIEVSPEATLGVGASALLDAA